ncbi:MAG: hypothetical protein JNK78_16010 [Planctomycetes bacterium]|nr:hypothetical protein [Planctomycetota bacterium]
MSLVARLPVQSPIVGLRLHSRHPAPGSPTAATVTELLDLGERERVRAAEGKQVTDCVAAMSRAVAELPRTVGARLDEIAAIAVELGLAIAREVAGAALDKGLADPTPTVVRCLRDCVHGADRDDLVVRLHPGDLELVKSRLAAMPELESEVATARLVADPKVLRGGVQAETSTGRLRYDPREAVKRISEEVRREVAS